MVVKLLQGKHNELIDSSSQYKIFTENKLKNNKYWLYINLTFIILVFTPLILIYRLIIKKEDFFRFKEKFCFLQEIKKRQNYMVRVLCWRIAKYSSIIEIYEKDKRLTNSRASNTLSSSKIVSNLRFKKLCINYLSI